MKAFKLLILSLMVVAGIAYAATKTIRVDKIIENTTDGGVDIDGVVIKDGESTANVKADTINEKTTNSGVTIEGVNLKDGFIDIPNYLKSGTAHVTGIWSPDYWASTFGWLGTNGSYATSLYSNGYRNTSDGFTYMGANGNTTTAGGIDIYPSGNIYFKGGSASGTTLPNTALIDVDGNIKMNGSLSSLSDGDTSLSFLGNETTTIKSGGETVYQADNYGFMQRVPTTNLLPSVAGQYQEFTATLSSNGNADGTTPATITVANVTSASSSACAAVQLVIDSFVRRGDSTTYQVQHFSFYNGVRNVVTVIDSDLGGGVTNAQCYWNGSGTSQSIRCRIDESYATATYKVRCMDAECGTCEPSQRWVYGP
jgi:hypothetical protein